MSKGVRWEGLEEWQISEEQWRAGVIEDVGKEITETAYKIERDAKLTVPVDTGDLRKSIETEIKGTGSSTSAEVGTDVEYSEHVEFGTSRQYAQPYLIPSFNDNVEDLQRTLESILGR